MKTTIIRAKGGIIMSVGFTEMMLIVLFVTIVFGAKRIPELARSLGRAQYEFNKAKSEAAETKQEIMDAVTDTTQGTAKK
jgi:sec-independent protein translocase protein TatA